MTVSELAKKHGFTAVALPDAEREISGCYMGDLLSWVMGRAEADCAWLTIMSNVNIIAVASLADVACIILTENVGLDSEVAETALAKGVNVLTSPLASYETAVAIAGDV